MSLSSLKKEEANVQGFPNGPAGKESALQET